ncbi:N,N-dimethylformamidase beta subunit family domain-containing protein [Mycolicibacterium mengxianglii]|uniref:N,N-dimethylformamidase beta subunit family domain-containing protein n=1 Tax=Mycolicibacterium mengxianglii TaxID=2736649 RepID=UPI0027DA208F|nr:N,N-dimethylformamidase beta subunit family domain-containing protein [Mycolicibacterium mengxianglii]
MTETDMYPDLLRLTGYASKWSVEQGQDVDFFVHCDGPDSYRAELVKLIHGDTHPSGPGFKEERIDSPANGSYPARTQTIHAGSYGMVLDRQPLRVDSFTLQCWIWPTMPTKVDGYWSPGEQMIAGKWSDGTGYGLFLDLQGRVCLRINDQTLTAAQPVRDRAWHFLAATYDAATGHAVLHHEPQIRYALDPAAEPVEAEFVDRVVHTAVPFTFAARPAGTEPDAASLQPHGWVMTDHYNGKIDAVRLSRRVLTRLEIETMKLGAAPGMDERRGVGPSPDLGAPMVAAWDFGLEIPTRTIVDCGPYRLDGELVGMPARGMTGHNWSGAQVSWNVDHREYGAIHFHDDDVDDARWDVDFTLTVPSDLPSAVYAVKLTTADGDEDYIPFMVRTPLGEPQAKIAVIMSTIDYMAYANEHQASNFGSVEALLYRTPIMAPQNIFLSVHREYGYSLYDTHADGSGVHISSRLRPILNVRPKYDSWLTQSPWQFNADLHLIDWLTELGYEFDVITDEDISYDGLERVEGYNVLITGSHPEHKDGHYLDVIQAYKERGGRLMYMGGDGFYWRHTFHPAYGRGEVTELRRCESGIRPWQAQPGEYYHQSDGKLGGMWRFLGRDMAAVSGTSMVAQGFDISTYFKRTPESEDPRVAWAFEGISYDERLGDFGLVGGGAAGAELDTVDTTLGSPPHTLLVATSAGLHTDAYLTVTELILTNAPGHTGTQNPRIRADMAFHETPNGGGVWSFSSISYCGSLSHNNYDNNISKLTANVLNRFMVDGPLPEPDPSQIHPRGRFASTPALNFHLPEELPY